MKVKSKNKIRVSIIEVNSLYLEGYLQLLSHDCNIEVLDFGTSAKTLFNRMNGTPPDVVLANVQSSDWDATELWSRIRRKYPNTRIVVNSNMNPGPLIKLLLRDGIASYFIKERITKEELVRILFEAHYKGISQSDIVTKEIIQEIDQIKQLNRDGLSDREYEILTLTCDGLGRAEISQKLLIAESTVKFHLDKLRERYLCRSVLQLVTHSLKEGIVTV